MKLENTNLSYSIHTTEDWIRLTERGLMDIYNDDIPVDDRPFIKNNLFHHATIIRCLNQNISELLIPSIVYCDDDSLITEQEKENWQKFKVTKINPRVFADCKNLASITIPSSIEYIGSYAFDNCPKLSKVIYAGTIIQWQNIEGHDNIITDVICVDGIYRK